MDGQGAGIGDGVVDVDKFHRHAARLYHILGLDHIEVAGAQDIVLPQLALQQAQGELGAIDGDVDAFEQIGEGADVVLMAVGEKYPPYLFPVALQIGEIGDDQVHPQHLVVREGQAAVHYNNVVGAFVQVDVFSDFPQTTQGDNPDRGLSLLAGGACGPPSSGPLSLPLARGGSLLGRGLGRLGMGRGIRLGVPFGGGLSGSAAPAVGGPSVAALCG